jgi:hypothetical protein
MKLKIGIVLFLAVCFYYTAKFFHYEGAIHAIYFYGKIDSDEYCDTWKKLNMCQIGVTGQCDGLYVPPDNVQMDMILEDTFLTFP